MSTQDGGERDEDLLRRYRQAGESAPAAPSAATRAAILAQAREAATQYAQSPVEPDLNVAAARAARSNTADIPRKRAGWKYAFLGTASAALLAGILVLPRFLQHPQRIAQVPAEAAQATAPAAAPPPADLQAPEAPPPVAARADAANQVLQPVLKEKGLADKKMEADRAAPGDALRRSSGEDSPALAESVAPSPPAEGIASSAAGTVTTSSAAVRAAAAPSRATAKSALQDRERDEERQDVQRSPAPAALSGAAAAAPLLGAVEAADLPRIRELIAAGAALEAIDAQGRTPLMLATLRGQADAVEALLQAGANPNAADRTGRTPLQAANQQGLTDIAALLRRAGAR